ncbi:TraR/DksA C4-type zinc finger protein [Streptomyces sp. MST-110588]|uniref:TraR/DksA family transcriptional regulator n=1 Tax=Streptomyces sp. MST-110588 TaxID=2833628 RepID=UPI001F5C72BB|nr:TraR/DksA C4-type zinc finger protein [Streptomyces sp. MST-110588]UNO42594.1 TraR/DksA C4-type zinc finger protein [Streptomyces sp. MST-110588]
MVAKKTTAKKSTASAGRTAAKKAAEKAPVKKAAEKAPVKKATAKKAAAKKAVKKTAAAKTVAAGTATNAAPAVKAVAAGTVPAGKTAPPKKTAPAKKTASAKKAVPAKKTGAKTVVAKDTAGGAPTAAADEREGQYAAPHGERHAQQPRAEEDLTEVPRARTAVAAPGELAVRPGEDPWSPAEVAEARTELMAEVGRLRTEIAASEDAIAGLMRDSGDGAGDDEADTGTKNITREHELALASNAREMLSQTERALERLDAGTYGLCENCGNPIGKARMQAFPRATLCVECKQKQERRS